MKRIYIIITVAALLLAPLFFWSGMFVMEKINKTFLKKSGTSTITLSQNEISRNTNASNEIPKSNETDTFSNLAERPTEAPATITTPTDNNSANNASQTDLGQGVTFAVIGDTKTFTTNPNGNLEKAVRSLTKQNFDLAFVMGDLVSSCDGGSSCETKYNNWKNVMAPILSKTYEIVGNHDRTGGNPTDAIWQREFNLPTNGPGGFSELTYSFDKGNSHFVVLDTEKPKEHSFDNVQQNWLEQDLAANKKENTFVFFHEPLFQMSQSKKDGMDANPKERDVLWNILQKHKVTAIFNGHYHMFARKNQNGIQQIVVGDTDSTADDTPQSGLTDFGLTGHHYSIVSVNGKEVDLKTYSLDGNLVNDFKFSK
ncbi:MAG: metallophosphoesterase [Candidatus Moranbacteria bacterium]|nr:metallophosphoesterase [Candidatus Moranbacteria bacterium]